MSSQRDKRDTHARTVRRGLLLCAVAVSAVVALSGTALAGPDELKGGSVQLGLQNGRGLKLSPKALTLQITTGQVDPITGAGTVESSGAFKAKKGKGKTKVKILGLTLGGSGGQGSLAAKVGKKKLNRFATLSGGTVTRDGWGAKIDGVTARLTSKGSKAIADATSPSKKGRASAAKGGQVLGTINVTTDPRAIEVLPGWTLVFSADMGFVNKLMAHCINGLLPDGVTAIAPAMQNLTVFTFPVTGGSISPDFTAGRVVSDGGQKIAKNVSLPIPNSCDQGPPVGTAVIQTQFQDQFDLQALASDTVLPSGPVGIGSLGAFDLSAATTSVDVNTKHLTIEDAPVHLDGLSAFVFNQVFPNESSDPNNDFLPGDLVGTMSLDVTTH